MRDRTILKTSRKRKLVRMPIVTSAAVMLIMTGAGCAAIPLATIGTAIGVGSSAISGGAGVYRAGKLDSAENASLADTLSAVTRATQDLSLSPIIVSQEVTRYRMTYVDDRESTLRIQLESRTPTLTRLRIDVGFFGSEPTARLLHERIRFHLEAAALPGSAATNSTDLIPTRFLHLLMYADRPCRRAGR